MGDKHEVKLELIQQKGDIQKIPSQRDLVKAGRWRIAAIISTLTIASAVSLALFSDRSIPTPVSTVSKIYTTEMNPVVSKEINDLKGQLVGLVSGSIESKLQSLEDSIRQGSVANSLGTVQDLKNDIQVLRAYSNSSALENTPISNAELLQEVSHLRNLIYLTLTSCGLMIAAAASIWIKNRKRLPLHEKEKITRYLGKL